jgi:hypothetical protein
MSQNAQGHILGHVKDLGGNYADLNTRGYMTKAEMLFHADGRRRCRGSSPHASVGFLGMQSGYARKAARFWRLQRRN